MQIKDTGTAVGTADGRDPTRAFDGNSDSYWQQNCRNKGDEVSFIGKQYQTTHRLAKINITTYNRDYTTNRIDVIGSNECADWRTASWTTLLQIDGDDFNGLNFRDGGREYVIPYEQRQSFSCIGLKGTGCRTCFAVNEIVLWEELQ